VRSSSISACAARASPRTFSSAGEREYGLGARDLPVRADRATLELVLLVFLALSRLARRAWGLLFEGIAHPVLPLP